MIQAAIPYPLHPHRRPVDVPNHPPSRKPMTDEHMTEDDLTIERLSAELTKAKAEHEQDQAAQRSIIIELQMAMADVFRHLGPPSDRYSPWREQVIASISAITAHLSIATRQREMMSELMPVAKAVYDILYRAELRGYLKDKITGSFDGFEGSVSEALERWSGMDPAIHAALANNKATT